MPLGVLICVHMNTCYMSSLSVMERTDHVLNKTKYLNECMNECKMISGILTCRGFINLHVLLFTSLLSCVTCCLIIFIGAAPEPSIKILDETKDWSLLQCVVRDASPQPKVEWKDSSGNILPAVEPLIIERGGRFYITLNTTVTKTDHYSCVITQEEIGHQTDAETYVHINGEVFFSTYFLGQMIVMFCYKG